RAVLEDPKDGRRVLGPCDDLRAPSPQRFPQARIELGSRLVRLKIRAGHRARQRLGALKPESAACGERRAEHGGEDGDELPMHRDELWVGRSGPDCWPAESTGSSAPGLLPQAIPLASSIRTALTTAAGRTPADGSQGRH